MRLALVERAMLLRISDTPGGFAVRRARPPLGWQIGSDQRDIPFTCSRRAQATASTAKG